MTRDECNTIDKKVTTLQEKIEKARHVSSRAQHARTSPTALSFALTVTMATYSVDIAGYRQSWPKCKCQEKIHEGEFRWGSHAPATDYEDDGRPTVFCSHLDCVSLKVFGNALAVYGTLEEIPGVVEHDALDALEAAFDKAKTVRVCFHATTTFLSPEGRYSEFLPPFPKRAGRRREGGCEAARAGREGG